MTDIKIEECRGALEENGYVLTRVAKPLKIWEDHQQAGLVLPHTKLPFQQLLKEASYFLT